MRTSATGAERGFTLVELMVVLVILGLAGAAVVMTAPQGPSLAAEAEAFGARLTRAKEEAILTNRTIGVRVDPQGYAFRVRTVHGWTALDEGPFQSATWSERVTADVEPEGLLVRFEPTGVAEPAEVALARDGRERRVRVDAAGNVRIDDEP